MNIRPLSKALQEIAETQLNEVTNSIEQELEELKVWLNQQKRLKYKNEDQFLLNILRLSKHNPQRARKRLEGFYTFRTMAPEVTLDMDPFLPGFQAFLEEGMCLPLPYPVDNETAPRVLLLRFGNYDPSMVSQVTMMKAGYAITEVLAQEDDNYILTGSKIICDMKGVQFQTFLQITPALLKKAIYCYQNGFPIRIKAVYIINIPSFYQPIVSLIKLVTKKKYAERLHFHSNDHWEEIYKDIPKAILPIEYGGESLTVKNLAEHWKTKMESCREFLLKENSYRFAESSKKVDDQSDGTDDCKLRGSFRMLDVD